nr:hypothetical protein Iba_scaffold28834.2CG0330 [Ipomoea batatas]
MSEFILSSCILMQPVISGFLELLQSFWTTRWMRSLMEQHM